MAEIGGDPAKVARVRRKSSRVAHGNMRSMGFTGRRWDYGWPGPF